MIDTTSLASTLLGYYLPISDPTVRINVALALGAIVSIIFTTLWSKIALYAPSINRWNRVTLDNTNPHWNKLLDYVYKIYSKESGIGKFTNENGNQKVIVIGFSKGCVRDGNYYISLSATHMVFESKLSVTAIENYINSIISLAKGPDNTLTVYVTDTVKTGETEQARQGPVAITSARWKKINMYSNRGRSNTIVSEVVQKELFDDLTSFDQSELLYYNRGLQYRRAYVFTGPPGSGKSALVEVIANMYGCPIFKLDLGSVTSSADLKNLMIEIGAIVAPKQRHIVLLEDLENTKFFKTIKYQENGGWYDGKGMPGSDAILDLFASPDSYNRIIIATTNYIDILKSYSFSDAMFRPGRIDREIMVGYCDEKQITNIMQLYFPEVKIDDLFVGVTITPAELNKVIQIINDAKQTTEFLTKFKIFKNGAFIEKLIKDWKHGKIDPETAAKVAVEANKEDDDGDYVSIDLEKIGEKYRDTEEFKQLEQKYKAYLSTTSHINSSVNHCLRSLEIRYLKAKALVEFEAAKETFEQIYKVKDTKKT